MLESIREGNAESAVPFRIDIPIMTVFGTVLKFMGRVWVFEPQPSNYLLVKLPHRELWIHVAHQET